MFKAVNDAGTTEHQGVKKRYRGCQEERNERVNETRTIQGNKEDSINGQSANLDIKVWDVVQKTLFPLSRICCAVLPLSPGLGFLDIEVRWGKTKRGSAQLACWDHDPSLTGSDRPGGE